MICVVVTVRAIILTFLGTRLKAFLIARTSSECLTLQILLSKQASKRGGEERLTTSSHSEPHPQLKLLNCLYKQDSAAHLFTIHYLRGSLGSCSQAATCQYIRPLSLSLPVYNHQHTQLARLLHPFSQLISHYKY